MVRKALVPLLAIAALGSAAIVPGPVSAGWHHGSDVGPAVGLGLGLGFLGALVGASAPPVADCHRSYREIWVPGVGPAYRKITVCA